jgi:hypothetical protein
MYQTILFSIQLLPRTIETLETVSSIVGSAFCGRTDKPLSVSEAFTNFWNVNCSSMEEPIPGWPEKIQLSLSTVTSPAGDLSMIDPVLLTEDATGYDADVSMESEDATAGNTFEVPTPDDEGGLLFPESEDEQESPVRLRVNTVNEPESVGLPKPSEPLPTIGPLGPAFAPAAANYQPATVISIGNAFEAPMSDTTQPPSTPTKPPFLTSTPPRPLKSSSTPATFLALPLRSPVTPLPSSQRASTPPKRTPPSVFSASRVSPSKRRSLEDKENMSPHPIVASLTERLALQSSVWSKDTVLGKRRAMDESQEGSALKKSKADSGESTPSAHSIIVSSDHSEEERSVERSFADLDTDGALHRPSASIPFDDPFIVDPEALTSASSGSGSSRLSPKKRKRVFMVAVEVPTLREIIIREQTATSDKRVLRRTRSATTKSNGLSSVQSSVRESLDKSSKKRSRRQSSEDLFSTSPSRALENINVIGSGQYRKFVPTALILTYILQMTRLTGC